MPVRLFTVAARLPLHAGRVLASTHQSSWAGGYGLWAAPLLLLLLLLLPKTQLRDIESAKTATDSGEWLRVRVE